MNKNYNLKLDLQFRCNNSIMKFNQFDNNTSDFFMRITNGGNLVDIEKALVVLAAIKPSGKVASQFVEVKNGLVYADLKPSMKDEIGTYAAQAMLILEDERVVTDAISYEVEEDKIFSLLNDTVGTSEEFTLLTDMLSRLSAIEISEEQRMINEAERILSEENRKIEEAKRVEAELVRQHEEADRTKYDATRESNENIRKINEEARISSENARLENEANRIEQEANRVKAEQLRKDNYNFMTEDEERRRLEANAHKEAEVLRVQAETNRVNEEAKRRTTEQARVSAENTRVNNENTRKANETTRQTNETQRVEAETQRQNRYNSFISDAEANASNFENYTNTAKVKEEERKSNELDRKSQEDRRVSNEVERISNENTRKANEVVREKNEASRQDVFENKVDEVDKKIVELNTTKDNFVSSVNTKVDTKISELDTAKSDMTNTVTNKIDEVENRFNALTSKQQQDAEVIDARDGETSLKARLDRDIEKAKQVYVNVEGNHISTDSNIGYAKDVEILGNTIQNASNLADIRSVGDKVEGQELYEIPVLSVGKNLFDGELGTGRYNPSDGTVQPNQNNYVRNINPVRVNPSETYSASYLYKGVSRKGVNYTEYDANMQFLSDTYCSNGTFTPSDKCRYIHFSCYCGSIGSIIPVSDISDLQLEEGTQATPYEPYVEDKLTILSPVQHEKVGDVRDRIIEKDGVWGVEKNIVTKVFNGEETWTRYWNGQRHVNCYYVSIPGVKHPIVISDRFAYGASAWDNESEDCVSGHSNGAIYIAKQDIASESDFKQWLQANPTTVKYQTTNPTFIPLPHDQQVKLRTFANKTNISFGCKIEGTIKAQIPKSIGATVNTHTKQISNLNKELDRVKKLEESTVSTVTTESDFTTVEATTNGYFEDVKLEGKTLVNIYPKTTPALSVSDRDNPKYNVTKKEGYIEVIGSDLEATNYRYVNMGRINFEMFKPNTTYTIVFTKFRGSSRITIQNGNSQYPIVKGGSVVSQDNKLLYTFVTTETLVKSEQILYLWVDPKSTTVDVEAENPMIFEGDLTANPPNVYIEGLKSVGDGTDEIVVSSVKGDGNLFDKKNIHLNKFLQTNGDETSIEGWFVSDYIKVADTCYIKGLINNASSNLARICVYDQNKTFKTLLSQVLNTTLNISPYIRNGDYIKITEKIEQVDNVIVCKNEMSNQIYQSDKKRLLYYNNETQTWEKPILREWDSVEKHSDGKYYYHQRSGKVMLNGSEDWKLNTQTQGESVIRFNLDATSIGMAGNRNPVISDKFRLTTVYDIVANEESIFTSIGGSTLFITISKSKLSTQDAEGFKQWLQANNVTVVYQLAQEKVYECTNIDLITYTNETNYIVESGAIAPKTTLKVHNNISNVVSLLQKKVSLLESNVTSYMITQNRLMLASRYNSDAVSFKVDYPSMMSEREVEIDYDLFKLIQDNIIVGPENYDVDKMLEIMDLYAMIGFITWEMWDYLYEVIDSQINPVIGDLEGTPEI